MLFSLRLLLFGDIYLFVFAKYDAGLIETTGAFFLVLTISLSVILFSLEYWCLFSCWNIFVYMYILWRRLGNWLHARRNMMLLLL